MPQPAPGTPGLDDEIIPTAIVIKNIPFNVKRETLLDIIVSCLVLLLFFFFSLSLFRNKGLSIHSNALRIQLSS